MWNKFHTDKPAYYACLTHFAGREADKATNVAARRDALKRAIIHAQAGLKALDEQERA